MQAPERVENGGHAESPDSSALSSQPSALSASPEVSVPDTFLLFRPTTDTLAAKVDLHRYLHDSFFSRDSIFLTEVKQKDYGVAGDPVPYTLRGDNTMTLILLFCFMLFVVSVAHSKRFIVRQTKHFFFLPPTSGDAMGETSGELRFQLFLAMLDCLLWAIAAFLYTTDVVAQSSVLPDDFLLVALLFAAVMLFYLLKATLYSVVNLVFFDDKINLRWMKSQLFITAAQGVMLFPVVLLQVYFELSLQNVAYCCGFILLITKILTFYKCWLIFFRRKGGIVQTFLYFCALEIVPLLVLGGAMWQMINILKVNF